MNLSAFSAKRKRQAGRILEEGRVLKTLSKHGKPEVIGSYSLNLMYDPDIDIVVEAKDPRKSSLAALDDFISQRGFQKYEYGDFVKFKRETRPEGFIVNLRKEVDSVKWEVEIWFLKSISKEQKLMARYQKELVGKRRAEVLRMKHERATNGLDKHRLSSAEIYASVIK